MKKKLTFNEEESQLYFEMLEGVRETYIAKNVL